jgi:hypothetical protein
LAYHNAYQLAVAGIVLEVQVTSSDDETAVFVPLAIATNVVAGITNGVTELEADDS